MRRSESAKQRWLDFLQNRYERWTQRFCSLYQIHVDLKKEFPATHPTMKETTACIEELLQTGKIDISQIGGIKLYVYLKEVMPIV